MCMDPHTENIYLLGGWDGNQDLSDLWVYHVPTKHWTLISKDTEMEVGPIATQVILSQHFQSELSLTTK